MEKYLKFIQLLEGNFELNQKYKSIYFFRSSKIKMILWYELLKKNFLNDKYTTEKLLLIVGSSKNTSRPTILKAISEGVREKFIIKEKNNDDKRKFFIYLNKSCIDDFKKWIKEIKISLHSIK